MPLLFTREQIKRHLAELGFDNLPEDQLGVFIHDLKKLIKLEEKRHLERKARGEISSTSTPYSTTEHERTTTTSHHSTIADAADEYDAWRHSDSDHEESESRQNENYKPTPESRQPKPRPSTATAVPSAPVTVVQKIQKAKPIGTGTDGIKARRPLATRPSTAHTDPPPYSGSTSSSSSLFGFEFGFGDPVESDEDIRAARKRIKNLPPESVRRDPVKLYHYYKSFWDKQRAPGENPRIQLRWNVRAGTLGRVPCDPCGTRVKYLR